MYYKIYRVVFAIFGIFITISTFSKQPLPVYFKYILFLFVGLSVGYLITKFSYEQRD